MSQSNDFPDDIDYCCTEIFKLMKEDISLNPVESWDEVEEGNSGFWMNIVEQDGDEVLVIRCSEHVEEHEDSPFDGGEIEK